MNDKSSPAYTSKAYDAMLDDLTLCRDVAGGTSTIRAEGTKYLPKHPREEPEDYDARLERSVVFNALGRTIRGLTGMVFRENPQIEAGAAVMAHLEDIDLQGSHIDVFAKDVFADALEVGHSAILVDAPQRAEGVRTKRDEQAMNLRPYWVHIKKENILSWRTVEVNGAQLLDQVVIREPGVEPDGEFGEQEVVRYRILRRANPVTWETWIETDNSDPVFEARGTINNVNEIPLAVVYADRTGVLTSNPPLLDLAHTVVAHYQTQSDHSWSLHKASVPILTIVGIDTQSPIAVGPNVCLKLPEGASASYTEHSGAALADTRQQIIDFKNDEAALGLAMLQHETRQAETAEAKRLDKSEQDSALSTAARGLQDALEMALLYHSQMIGASDNVGVIVNRDYETLSLDAQEIAAYSALVANGQISLDTLWSILDESGNLPDDFDAEVERANLEAEAVSMMAEFEQRQQEVEQEQTTE